MAFNPLTGTEIPQPVGIGQSRTMGDAAIYTLANFIRGKKAEKAQNEQAAILGQLLSAKSPQERQQIAVGSGNPQLQQFYLSQLLQGEQAAAQRAQMLEDERRKQQMELETFESKEKYKSEQKKAEAQELLDKKYNAFAQGMNDLASAFENLGAAEQGIVAGRAPAVTSEAQTVEGSIKNMSSLLKEVTRGAGEGTFTDRDQEILNQMLPTRTDTPDARRNKMRQIMNIVDIKMGKGDPELAKMTVEQLRKRLDGQASGESTQDDPLGIR